MTSPALFLDRDGVINIDYGYVHSPDNFIFLDGVFDIVSQACSSGYRVVVVTNQAGIGRGYYTEQDFYSLTEWMKSQFALNGGFIDAVYFCPHHPTAGIGLYRKECSCRKPSPGMLLQAQLDLDIDLHSSLLVGDKLSDMDAGLSAGISNLFYFNGRAENCTTIYSLSELLPFLSTPVL